MVLAIQIIGFGFAVFMLYLTFVNSKKKEFTAKEWIFWSIIWVGIGIFALFPQILDVIVVNFKFARTLDVLITGASIFILGLLFYVYVIVRRCQKSIDELVRKMALEKK